MSLPFNITNPGFSFSGVLTSQEGELVTNLASLTPDDGDTFIYDSGTGLWTVGPGGGGDISKVGTPANNEVAVWTGDGTLEGASTLVYDGSALDAPAITVDQEAYGVGWSGSPEVPTKDDVYDKIESLSLSGGITWSEVTGTSVALAVNNAYILNNAGLVTATLPDTAALGSVIKIVGKGTGGWLLAQNASENINFGNVTTTTGVGGSLASVHRYDCVEIVCTVANTTWTVTSSIGNITYV